MRKDEAQKEDKLREAQLPEGAHSSDTRKKLLLFYITRKFVAVSPKARHLPHPEPNQSSPLLTPCFCKIHLNIILSPNPRCYTSSLFSDFPTKWSVTHACHMPNPTQHLTFLYTSKPQTSVFWASFPTRFKPSTQPNAKKLVLWIPAYCNKDQIARDCQW
jgi:hypothetical protein